MKKATSVYTARTLPGFKHKCSVSLTFDAKLSSVPHDIATGFYPAPCGEARRSAAVAKAAVRSAARGRPRVCTSSSLARFPVGHPSTLNTRPTAAPSMGDPPPPTQNPQKQGRIPGAMRLLSALPFLASSPGPCFPDTPSPPLVLYLLWERERQE